MSTRSSESAGCVAVVAVHGVADQKPHETARTIADLLSRVEGAGAGRYRAFEETELRLGVSRVMTEPAEAAQGQAMGRPAVRTIRQVSAELFAMRQTPQLHGALADVEPAPDTPGELGDGLAHEYMKHLLSVYRPDAKDRTFETVRLESVRNSTPCRVHVYEAYWADLSRLESGVLSAMLELYQLMFYVCSLGRKSIEYARLENRSRWWGVFAWAHALVEWPLVLGVPILNLLLLALAAVIFTIRVPSGVVVWIGIGGIATSAALLAGAAIYALRLTFRGARWPFGAALIVALAELAVGCGLWLYAHSDAYHALGFVAFLLLGALVLLLMAAYQRRRRGAFAIALVLAVLVALDFACQLWSRAGAGPGTLLAATLRSVEGVLLLLSFCWGLVLLGVFLTALVGAGAVRFGADAARRPRAKRAAWTANLTAMLPALVVIILNLAAWSAIHKAGTEIITELKPGAAQTRCPEARRFCYEPRLDKQAGVVDAGDAIRGMLDRSVRPLSLIGPVAIAALLWVAWSLFPALAGEFPRLISSGRHAAEWLGDALSAGFRAMRLSGRLLQLLYFVLLVLGMVVVVSTVLGRPCHFGEAFPTLAGLLGALVILFITSSKGPFRFLALGFRSALDVALDVTNWLRVHPLDRNPRARICARYASLLRHICLWTDPADGRRYDAVVVIAHSQGTVITAELLRFLQRARHDPALSRLHDDADRLPVYLFTMGCPLRQLYGLRFPHLYEWAWHDDTAWPGHRPDRAALGVAAWANAYRSGDYVGRYLWFPEARPNPEAWSAAHQTQARDRLEVCVGAGAHTHYWDAPDTIGRALDQIIARAGTAGPALDVAAWSPWRQP
jgi:hypothetical protein